MEREVTGFYMLLRAHDRVWGDRSIQPSLRMQVCDLLWKLAILITRESGLHEEAK
jgi:hypothetical protein